MTHAVCCNHPVSSQYNANSHGQHTQTHCSRHGRRFLWLSGPNDRRFCTYAHMQRHTLAHRETPSSRSCLTLTHTHICRAFVCTLCRHHCGPRTHARQPLAHRTRRRRRIGSRQPCCDFRIQTDFGHDAHRTSLSSPVFSCVRAPRHSSEYTPRGVYNVEREWSATSELTESVRRVLCYRNISHRLN